MSAHTVVRQEMPVGIEETFDMLHDYPARLTWDTLLRRAETVDGVPPDKGVEAVCRAGTARPHQGRELDRVLPSQVDLLL